MIKIFYSNRIENLYQDLKQRLYASAFPFARRMIIVPTPAIKSWLLLQLAKDPEIGIAAGLEILYLDDSLQKVHDLISKNQMACYIPNQLELTLTIEGQIRQVAASWNTLSSTQKNTWLPLLNYLKISFDSFSTFSRRSEKRLAAIAETLAKLFIEYGKYGQGMIEKWKEAECQEWQHALWLRLFSTKNIEEMKKISPPSPGWNVPFQNYQSLELTDQFPNHLQIHLFSISFLPRSEYGIFQKASELFPVHYYALSPCSLFWSDILSDKEAQKLQKYWDKHHAPQDQQQALEDYLRDKNPLLANWGKLGRRMAEQLEKQETETFSHYTLPASIQNENIYADYIDDSLVWEQTTHPASLLDHLQADILVMRNPRQSAKIPLENNDRSIQLHCAPTLQREVQILYNNLLQLFKEDGSLEPGDIIVMAPDIMTYAPYIRQVFGAEESQLDFQVMDMQAISEDALIKQFWHLIDLPFGRWDAENVTYLFNFPSFQKRHQLTSEEVLQIHSWLEETGIRWGENASHRNELLHQRHCGQMIEETDKGTWEGGFSRLLQGLVMQDSQDQSSPFPLPGLEYSRGVLLGKWIALVRSLRQDLKQLSDGTQKTYPEWILELKRLITLYLTDKKNDDENEDLFDRLEDFVLASRWMPQQKTSFIALKKHLETFLNRHTFVYRENHLQAVKFCSMLPMRAIPAKVIALMGMNENAFPRTDNRISLNLMKDNSSCDYCPSRTDYDRYLFLEALLSARQRFMISYTNYSAGDGKEQAPSLLVAELMGYIDLAYTTEKQKVTEALIYKHPYRSFDFHYFSPDSDLKNYSQSDYRAALSYYQKDKKPQHRFLHDFKLQTEAALPSSEITLDIKHISNAIHNPIKSYFNKTLGIYLKDEDDAPQTEESFAVDHLQIYNFKKSSLKQNLKHVIHDAEKSGKLPLGLFKQTAIHRIQNKVREYHETLGKMDVDTSKVFVIQVHEQYEEPVHDSLGWKLPPFSLKYKGHLHVKIIGTLPEVSESGLIANIKGDEKDVSQSWAEFVFLNCLIDHYQLPIQKQLLCAKSGKIKNAYFDDPVMQLEQILEYYFLSLHHPSPLTKEWLHDLLYKEPDELQKAMQKSLNDSFNPIYNEYITWTCRTGPLDAVNMIEHWQMQARHVFSNLFQAWTAKDE